MTEETQGRRVAVEMLSLATQFNDRIGARLDDPYLARNEVVLVLCRLLADGAVEKATIDRLVEDTYASTPEIVSQLESRGLVSDGPSGVLHLTAAGRDTATRVVEAFVDAVKESGIAE